MPSSDPPGQDSGDSSIWRGSALHPCALSEGFALELMRRDSFPWGDMIGGSSACTFSTRELEHPLQQGGGREGWCSRTPACYPWLLHHFSSFVTPKRVLPPPSFLCLFVSPSFPCRQWKTGIALILVAYLDRKPSAIAEGQWFPTAPSCMWQDPSSRQGWQGGELFDPLQPCCSFTAVAALPLQKQAPGLPWPHLCFLAGFLAFAFLYLLA